MVDRLTILFARRSQTSALLSIELALLSIELLS